MSLLTVIFFFISTFGFGYSITRFVKESDNFLERNLMRLGFGLAVLPALGLLFVLFRIPLDWRIFLALSLVVPLIYLIKNIKNISPELKVKIKKSYIPIAIMLIIFFLSFFMYHKGAFIYPYLEDDDPWSHASAAKYVSIEKTVLTPEPIFHYMDPYPPTYDLLFGVLHQTNNSVKWTLKFFNALIISMSLIFFYFFMNEFSGNSKKALFATFCLAAVPAFLSHFIWALALTVPLYFVVFYAVGRIKYDKKWWIVTGVVMITTLTSSPTHSTYFGIFFVLYYLTKTILERKFLVYHTLAGILGLVGSFILWWLPMIFKHTYVGLLKGLGLYGRNIAAIEGTADRAYTAMDFFVAKGQNMINNPIGIGIVLSILTIIGIIAIVLKNKSLMERKNNWIIIAFVWFLMTLYAVNAINMPIKLSPFRAWMLLAIPLCMIAAEGLWLLFSLTRNIGIVKILIVILVIIGIVFTSAVQKYTVNTAQWPPGGFWTSNEEIQGYVWLDQNTPLGSRVFSFGNQGIIIGFSRDTCSWCPDIKQFNKNGINESVIDIHKWLVSNEYEYLVIDGSTARRFGAETVNSKIQEIANTTLFRPIFQNPGILILEV